MKLQKTRAEMGMKGLVEAGEHSAPMAQVTTGTGSVTLSTNAYIPYQNMFYVEEASFSILI